MVRAGRGGYLFEDFMRNNVVAIGWEEVKSLSKVTSNKEMKEVVRNAYPELKGGKFNMSASQISKFRLDFEVGDFVITYDPQNREYWIGEIIGEYEYNTKLLEFPHIRRVKWIKGIERDDLSVPTKNTLGAISTIFELSREAKSEILDLLEGKKSQKEEHEETEEDIKQQTIDKAHEFIKDKLSELDWDEMQELVAGILKSMGYRTRIAPIGPDLGKDIVASPDGLGLLEPRIIVQVKHRSSAIGAPDLRSFMGGLRGGHKGIYVSTGGFTKEARYEAERANVPFTLVNLDDLVELITQNYDSFDAETRALIPLTKIYWPE